ncbi:MAG: hypothetical protein Kow00127_02760 [Bacteroidales bacterium]
MNRNDLGGGIKILLLRKVARVWSIVIILMAVTIVAGALINLVTTGSADPNSVPGYPFIENLPVIFLFAGSTGLAIAWRNERLGGMITVISQLLTLPVLIIHWPITRDTLQYLVAPYGLSAAVVVPGILFLICYAREKKLRSA